MKSAFDILTNRFNGKKTVLLGAGVSNTPLAKFLVSFGASVEIRDKKNIEELGENAKSFTEAGASLVLGEGYLDNINADFIFRSPGFRPDIPAIKNAVSGGARLTSETELFMEIRPAFVFGVTGSDGKSTTTTLIYEILKENFKEEDRKIYLGGNIGYPLLNRVLEMDERSYVSAEFSSFQLMTVSLPADVAVITNVSPNHLNWHTGMDEYIEAKKNILNGVSRAVLNYGCEVTRELGKKCACPVTYFSKETITPDMIGENDRYICLDGENMVAYDKKSDSHTVIMKKSDILLPGLHNAENYMAAAGALWDTVDPSCIKAVAKRFGGVKHRLELVKVSNNIYYYNSSIDSSPTRTAAALSAITDRPINLICGGYDKNIPFEPLARAIAESGNVKSVTLTGATAAKIMAAIEKDEKFDRNRISVETEPDFKSAVKLASSKAESGDAVLLSPACASFDAFENFEKRGEFFAKTVREEL